jgi:hypothetical protein
MESCQPVKILKDKGKKNNKEAAKLCVLVHAFKETHMYCADFAS